MLVSVPSNWNTFFRLLLHNLGSGYACFTCVIKEDVCVGTELLNYPHFHFIFQIVTTFPPCCRNLAKICQTVTEKIRF